MKNRILTVAVVALTAVAAVAAEPAFLVPPQHAGPPLPLHATNNRAFQGIPSMAVSPGGRLWATWYAGKTPGEDHNNYVVLTTSGDGGRTWREVLIVDPDESGPVRAFDPELWLAPDGTMRLVWAQSIGHDGSIAGVWFLKTADPDSEKPAWEKPRRITDGIMMCKPLVLKSGEWVLPASTWRKTDDSAKMVVSTDQGKTWTIRGGCNVPAEVRAFDEHMLIERKDGSLWLLARTNYGIGESMSTDRGESWPELTPSAISHPSARFFIRRLNSGSILLVKHGPIDKRTGRSHLTAFVSTDDGKTFGGGLLLDERSGVSYPDGQQTPDGLIRIIYDYSRTGSRHILMATFREEDVAAGKPTSGAVRLRGLVSEASGGMERKPTPPPPARENKDGKPLRKTPAGTLSMDGASAVAFEVGTTLFTDRTYQAAERPAAFEKAKLLRIPIDGAKRVQCDRAGMVYMLTPEPDRNRDSLSKSLMAEAFEKVAMPKVRLFAPSTAANYCTVYQKECKKGEVIELGKWAVPVFLGGEAGD